MRIIPQLFNPANLPDWQKCIMNQTRGPKSESIIRGERILINFHLRKSRINMRVEALRSRKYKINHFLFIFQRIIILSIYEAFITFRVNDMKVSTLLGTLLHSRETFKSMRFDQGAEKMITNAERTFNRYFFQLRRMSH